GIRDFHVTGVQTCALRSSGVAPIRIVGIDKAAWREPLVVGHDRRRIGGDTYIRAQVFLVERPKEQVTLAILLRPGGGCQFMYVGNGLCKWFFAGLEAVQFWTKCIEVFIVLISDTFFFARNS